MKTYGLSTTGIKLLLTVEEAAEQLGIGRTSMYALLRTGAVRSVPVGRLRRIRPADLDAYVAGLPATPLAQSYSIAA